MASRGSGKARPSPRPAAMVNAINGALRPLNVEIDEIPATSRRTLAAILQVNATDRR